MKNNILKNKKRLLLTLFAGMLISVLGYTQSMTVTGHITDAYGDAVIGATVMIKGTTTGTTTDFDGNFSLNASSGSVLVISYMGLQTIETTVTSSSIQIVMQDDNVALDEMVVIGYGSVKKADLSGSVVAIKAEEMNKGAITSPQELLQGKISGVLISPGDGQPGAGSTIRIRSGASLNSSNDPLVIIDGIPVSNDAAPGSPNALATINPNDIETFTVLKDASATAIYGSRASNGVIVITTKRGSADRLKVEYASTYSISDPVKKIDMLNTREFRNVINETYPQSSSVHDIVNQYPDQSTNWQDQIFRTAFSTDQNIAVSGTIAKQLPFRASFGYTNNDGTLKTSNYERYTGAIKLNPSFFDKHLTVDLNVKGTLNNNRYADSGAINAAAFYDPTKPTHNDGSQFNGYWNVTNNDGNPVTLALTSPLSLLYDVNNTSETKRFIGNLQLNYKIHGFEDLQANANFGYDTANGQGDNYVNPGSFQAAKDTQFPDVGQGTSYENIRRNEVMDFYLNYSKEIPSINSNISAMAGYSWQHFYYKDKNMQMSNPTEPGYLKDWEYNEKTGRFVKEEVNPWENYLISFFGRLNYSFLDRYLLTATIRRDGSSKFAKGNQWGTFPSVALAWSVIREPFMINTQHVLSNLKLRLGYGVTGQQDITDYQFMVKYYLGYTPETTYLGSYLLKPGEYNPDLKWEETATYNIALDYGFLNNRINGSIEYYQKHTKDLLNETPPAAGTNFVNIIVANIGKMKNSGLEFHINATPIDKRNFKWEVGYNVTWNTSEVTKLTVNYNPDYTGIDAGGHSFGGTRTILQKHVEGYAPYTFMLYQQIYDENGNPIQNAFVDRNKDGKITEADRYLTDKNPMPDVYMGFSSTFSYKNWDLGFNMRANFGNYVYNAFAADNATVKTYRDNGYVNNLYKGIYNTGFTEINSSQQIASDYFLENASFLKMDNITVGYSFNKLFTNKISGRINASLQNVFTITKYSGLDPECPGIDYNIWPRPMTYTLGLTLNF